MAIDGWSVQEKETRDLIRAASGHIDDLPTRGEEMTTYFTNAAEACDHIAIGAALDEVLQNFMGPLITGAYDAGNHVLAQLELAVQAYMDGDEQMGDDALESMTQIPVGAEGGDDE